MSSELQLPADVVAEITALAAPRIQAMTSIYIDHRDGHAELRLYLDDGVRTLARIEREELEALPAWQRWLEDG